MEKYQIIPRKFRPKRFDEVVGQEAIVSTLKNALKSGRIAQAYLFSGSRGCGKTTLARLLAKALNCEKLDENDEPCNNCSLCKEIALGNSLDVLEIDGASNRGIDDIRQINETVGYAPSKSKFKIYIIDEVHMLTKEAFNALLKTLEEPPQNVKFFFATTEPHKVPSTITSRCQRFDLRRLPESAICEKLEIIAKSEKLDIEPDALALISKLSDGGMRDAESLLDQLVCHGKSPITLKLTEELLGLASSEFLSQLDQAIHSSNLEEMNRLSKSLFESGKALGSLVDALLKHFHNHLLTILKTPSESTFSKDQCLTIIDLLLSWQQQMLKTPFKQIHLEMLFFNLARSKNKVTLDTLVDRLIQLEERLGSKEIAFQKPKPQITPPQPEPQAQVEIEEKIISKPSPQVSNPEDKHIPMGVSQDQSPHFETSEAEPVLKNMDAAARFKDQEDDEEKSQASNWNEYKSKYDTLVRFAAVELEGVVKNPGS